MQPFKTIVNKDVRDVICSINYIKKYKILLINEKP